MKVTRKPTTVKAGDINVGDTFRYTDADGTVGEFIRMKKNACFNITFRSSRKRADGVGDMLIYNIIAKCFGTLNIDADVTPTDSEIVING
jgi:hypothetical protein